MIKYDVIVDYLKICFVYRKICSRTKHRKKLIKFELSKFGNFINIYISLKNRTYTHDKYNIFLIKIPKYRIIMSEGLSDKIVNHLVSLYILSPVIEPKLLDFNVATRKDKGLDKGIFFIKKYLNQIKWNYENFYVLKCDVNKYFYNINHEILLEKLRKIIFDEEIISLIENIISSTDQSYVNEEIKAIKNEEKNRIARLNTTDNCKKRMIEKIESIPLYENKKCLPIGNMTSQLLAVFYLNDLDHYIKEVLKIKYYVRYMDDFILLHEDRKYLQYCQIEIEKKLDVLKLKLNKKTQIFNLKNGLSFLGYRFIIKNNKVCLISSRSMQRKIRKRYRKEGVIILDRYNGYLKRSKSNQFKYNLSHSKKKIDINNKS